jgi:signal transduction histidine kinase
MVNKNDKDKEKNIYPIKDLEVFFEHILNLNFEIEKNIFKKLNFKDPLLEKKFEEYEFLDANKKRIVLDSILVIGHIVSIIYVLIFLNKPAIILLFVINAFYSILISFYCYWKKIHVDGHFLDHMNVFLMNLSFIGKPFLIFFLYFDNYHIHELDIEMIRIIIYHFIFLNLVILVKFNASFFTYTVYYIFNLVVIISAMFFTSKQIGKSIIFEAGVSFGFTYLMFAFRKLFEYLSRLIYSERYKFEKLYKYSINFIKGLEHNYIVLKDDKSIFINEKFSQNLDREEIEITNNNFNSYNPLANNVFQYDNNNTSTINLKNQNKYYSFILKELILVEDEDNYFISGDFDSKIKNINPLQENNLLNMINEVKEKKLIKTYNFFELGIFKFINNNLNKFYRIIIRKHENHIRNENDYYIDIIFLDISDLFLMKKKIFEENLIKERVIAKLAHELKTPINSIMGLINIIAEETSDFPLKQKRRSSIRSSNSLIKRVDEMKCITSLSNYTIYLVNDIIQYSSNKSPKNVKLNIESINLLELVEFCYDILESLLNINKSKKDIVKPILEIDPIIHRLVIYSDDIRLKQILLNLVSNSVKFCRREVIIRCKYENQMVTITVKDTGIGIKSDDLNRLFNDFVMLEDENNLNKQGSGLGLSICKTLTNLLNIDLKFTSEYNVGTEAILTIPVNEILESEISFFEEEEFKEQIPKSASR